MDFTSCPRYRNKSGPAPASSTSQRPKTSPPKWPGRPSALTSRCFFLLFLFFFLLHEASTQKPLICGQGRNLSSERKAGERATEDC